MIFDRQYSPFLYNQNNQRYIPAESVYGVLEVKQMLNRGHMIYAGKKAASVRRLKRTSAPIPHAAGVHDPRPVPHIISGLVTYQSSWNPPFGDGFREALGDLRGEARLDIGCSLQEGTFEAAYSQEQLVDVVVTTGARSLLQFFLHLLKRLQELATVPAIDYEAYLARFEGGEAASK